MSEFHLIAHRGNMCGKTKWENHPDYLLEALQAGFDIEVDVWIDDSQQYEPYNGLYLGHDTPTYKIDVDFLKNDKIWVHAKNHQALQFLLENNVHCFWHENDDHTLTSKGYIWTYPGKPVTQKSVIVKLEKDSYKLFENRCSGYCSDYLESSR